MEETLTFLNGGVEDKFNWFYNKYYIPANYRYWTFNIALNILNQKHIDPVIVETGCQRDEFDLGCGMSTTIFAEYITRYGGTLHTVDISENHINRCINIVKKWNKTNINFHCQDSIEFLNNFKEKCDLIYLDSYDYPYCEILSKYSTDELNTKSNNDILLEFGNLINPCQEHCLKEFLAIENKLTSNAIVLIDDNKMAGGGKPGILKPLLMQRGWICLLEYQQSLWVREI